MPPRLGGLGLGLLWVLTCLCWLQSGTVQGTTSRVPPAFLFGPNATILLNSTSWPNPYITEPFQAEPSCNCSCLNDRAPGTIHDIFWHITLFPGKEGLVSRTVDRQFGKIVRSGLLDVSTLHIGLVASPETTAPPPLQQVLAHPHVRIASFATSGHECVTTQPLWRFARNMTECCAEQSCCGDYSGAVLYLHSKGVTYNFRADIDDWCGMMEYFVIEYWRYSIYAMQSHGALTTGCYYTKRSFQSKNQPHYSGNFFWTNVSYAASLPIPSGDRYACGEMWILKHPVPGRHLELHAPFRQKVLPGAPSGLYMQRYQRQAYDCPIPATNATVAIPSYHPCYTKLPCHGMVCPKKVNWRSLKRGKVSSGLHFH